MITDFSQPALRQDFTILKQVTNNNRPLVYLDNAATSQKPSAVVDTISHYYQQANANVHRSAHFLADKANAAFETARTVVQQFINASSNQQIIWTSGATEAINLVAATWGDQNLSAGDLIILSEMEHHANIVPWQLLAQRTGAVIKPVRLTADLQLDMDHYRELLQQSPKLVAISHVSNAIGTINPIATIIALAKQVSAVTLIDGAQAIGHFAVDVQQLDCDFYVFSGHKLFGPTGIGVLYGRHSLLESMPVWQGGGEMIAQVSFAQTTFNQLPYKFEAGTPNIAGAVGLAAAITYLNQYDRPLLLAHEQALLAQISDWMAVQPQIKLFSRRQDNVGILAFTVEGEHPQDIGILLDQQGIAVRTGHHCAMPLMAALGLNGTVRVSFSIYNDESDVKALIAGLTKVLAMLDE